jgi:hypothetical protein
MEETRWLLGLAERSPSILGVVGWADLRSPDIRAQLKVMAQNPKLVGIRHIVQSEPDDRFLLQPDFRRGVSVLEEFDLAYDILIYTPPNSCSAFRASVLSSIIWPSPPSRAAASTLGRMESRGWPTAPTYAASFQDWLPKPTGHLGSPSRSFPFLMSPLNRSDRIGS